MKQVVQAVSGGPVKVMDVPRPTIGATEVLVHTGASVVSAGTEAAVTKLAQSSLLAKARARPDLVRQVVAKAKRDGLVPTAKAVKARNDELLPLGYSAAGTVLEVGEAVEGIVPGQVVATGGARKANHAELQAVPGMLCSVVPDGVAVEDAAFATVASIALHGIRLAEIGPGAKVVVVGLGLIGQLAVRLAQAAGCDVAGIDVADHSVERARASGALGLVEAGEETTKHVMEWSRGRGADAVLVAAGTPSSALMGRTPALCRDRADVVVVGDVGLELERRPFYEKELTMHFARSYGPGRYERSYEDWGVDYPAGFVRWTEGRNQEAVLDLLAAGRLSVADLVTHRFPIADAADAYELIEKRSEPFLAIELTYPAVLGDERPVRLRAPRPSVGDPGVGLVGAGAFASTVLMPNLKAGGFQRFVSVASASGLSATQVGARAGFEKVASGADAVIDDPEVDVVVVATPHGLHAPLVVRALKAGKHVFCEKPLALTLEELDDISAAWEASDRVLFVGFNRRWSQPVEKVRRHFEQGSGPLVITYRVSAGQLPASHWYHDRREGGRLLGEACHFVDTCAAIVGHPTTSVHAEGSGRGERLLHEDLGLVIAYADGSIATITYASDGHPSSEKERVEVLGRGRSAVIADFSELTIDGKHVASPADKGHLAEAQEFRAAIRDGRDTASAAISSTRTTLLAAASLDRSDLVATPEA